MVNCPQWGIGVGNLTIVYNSGTTVEAEPTVASCDSLVQVCLSAIQPGTSMRIDLEIALSPNSSWVHLAEVSFWNNNNTCPPDIVVTGRPSLPAMSPITENASLYSATEDTPSSPPLISTSEPARSASEREPIITVIIVVTVSFLLLLLVGVVVVVLVLWRCRHQHTAKEEALHTSSQTHTHPVVSLCEETGQVQYVSQQQDTDQDNPTNVYSSLNVQAEKKGANTRNYQYDNVEMQEYSVLHHGAQPQKSGKKHEGGQAEQFQEYSTLNHGKTPVQSAARTDVYNKIDQKNQVKKQSAKGKILRGMTLRVGLLITWCVGYGVG